jgi:hypothetical protein
MTSPQDEPKYLGNKFFHGNIRKWVRKEHAVISTSDNDFAKLSHFIHVENANQKIEKGMKMGGVIFFKLFSAGNTILFRCHLFILFERCKQFVPQYLGTTQEQIATRIVEIQQSNDCSFDDTRDLIDLGMQNPDAFQMFLEYLYTGGVFASRKELSKFCFIGNYITSVMAKNYKMFSLFYKIAQKFGVEHLTSFLSSYLSAAGLEICKNTTEQINKLQKLPKVENQKIVLYNMRMQAKKIITEMLLAAREQYVTEMRWLTQGEDDLCRVALRATTDLKLVACSEDRVSENPIFCHLEYLTWKSQYFTTMVNSSFKEAEELRSEQESNTIPQLKIYDVSEVTLRLVIQYLYAESCVITNDTVIDLIYLAMQMELEELVKQAEKYIEKNFAEMDYVDVLVIASLRSNERLRQRCIKKIVRLVAKNLENVETVINNLKLAEVSEQDLQEVLDQIQ